MNLVAVTGASGHLGVNICTQLLQKGHRVRAIHRLPSKAFANTPAEELLGEITDKEFMRQALRGAGAVIHCAAKISIDGDKDGEVRRTNVRGTECVADLCRQLSIPRLVHISSVHAFNLKKATTLCGSDSLVEDRGFAYDRSKRDGLLGVQRAIANGLNAVILCPVGLLGPEDYKFSLMGGFFVNLYRKKLPALVRGAFHWSDVRDTAAAAIRALDAKTEEDIYLLGGHYATVAELADIAKEFCEKPAKLPKLLKLSTPPTLPYEMALLGLPFLRGFAYLTGVPPLYTYESLSVLRHHPQTIDDTPARRDLSYRLRPLRDTVADTYDWFRRHGDLQEAA